MPSSAWKTNTPGAAAWEHPPAHAKMEDAIEKVKKEWGEELIDLIKNGKIRLGMTKEQVMVSWGKIPWDISKSVSVFGSTEIWKYRRNGYYYYVTFHNNIVTSIDQY